MNILALDPGTTETGLVWFENGRVRQSLILPNDDTLAFLSSALWRVHGTTLAIEMIASYGMAVGKEVFETVWWIGRFNQAWHDPAAVRLIYRKDVKLNLCGTAKAKDGNIRQALIDRVGPQGTKKAPGATYGVKSHMWAALGVAVTVADAVPA